MLILQDIANFQIFFKIRNAMFDNNTQISLLSIISHSFLMSQKFETQGLSMVHSQTQRD